MTVATFSIEPLEFYEIWYAGHVARFHAENVHRRQTVGEHSWGVAVICATLWPTRHMLLKQAIFHDAPEKILGDNPHPAKQICIDHRKESAAEVRLLSEVPLLNWPPTDQDEVRLKIADMLDFVLTVQREVLMGNSLAKNMLRKGLQLTVDRIMRLSDPIERRYVAQFLEKTIQDMMQDKDRYDDKRSGDSSPLRV